MIPAKLPVANTGIQDPGRPPRENAQEAWCAAWQKEMERMHADAWFGRGAGSGMQDAPAAQGGDCPRPSALLASGPPGAAGSAHLLPATGGVHVPAAPAGAVRNLIADLRAALPALDIQAGTWPQPVQTVPQSLPSSLPAAIAQAGQVAAAATAESCEEPPRSQGVRGAIEGAERQPVRVHVEWTGIGVKVWLGMDARATVPAAQLVLQVQRSLAASGCRLLSVTCNGQPVPLGLDGFFPTNSLNEMEALTWPSAP